MQNDSHYNEEFTDQELAARALHVITGTNWATCIDKEYPSSVMSVKSLTEIQTDKLNALQDSGILQWKLNDATSIEKHAHATEGTFYTKPVRKTITQKHAHVLSYDLPMLLTLAEELQTAKSSIPSTTIAQSSTILEPTIERIVHYIHNSKKFDVLNYAYIPSTQGNTALRVALAKRNADPETLPRLQKMLSTVFPESDASKIALKSAEKSSNNTYLEISEPAVATRLFDMLNALPSASLVPLQY